MVMERLSKIWCHILPLGNEMLKSAVQIVKFINITVRISESRNKFLCELYAGFQGTAALAKHVYLIEGASTNSLIVRHLLLASIIYR